MKFRVWDRAAECYVDLDAFQHQIFLNCRGEAIWWSHAGFENVSERMKFEYFAEKQDHDGKDIYEGDILKGEYPDIGTVEFGEHETSTDFYASKAYGWYLATPSRETYSLEAIFGHKIVGNERQNPELLSTNPRTTNLPKR